MVRCSVLLIGLDDKPMGGAEQTFVIVPRVGDETVVAVGGTTWACRVDQVRHIAENALDTSPAAITIFVSPYQPTTDGAVTRHAHETQVNSLHGRGVATARGAFPATPRDRR
jgi:hypothetical protein